MLRHNCLGYSQFFFNFGRDLLFLYRDIILSFHSFYYRDRKLLYRDTGFFLQLLIMSQQEFLCHHSSCVTLQLLVATGNSPTLVSVDLCCILSILCRDRTIFCHDRVNMLIVSPLCCNRGNLVVTQLLCYLL